MRTKWQSGPMAGNTMAQRLTGNRLTGDGRRAAGKSNPYLSRKINLRRCPVQTVLIPLKPWLQKRLRDGLTAVEITDRKSVV